MRETPAASVAQYTPDTPHRRDLDITYFPVPLLVLFFVLCFLVVVLFRKTVERGGWQEGTGRLVRSVRDASGDREKSGWGREALRSSTSQEENSPYQIGGGGAHRNL